MRDIWDWRGKDGRIGIFFSAGFFWRAVKWMLPLTSTWHRDIGSRDTLHLVGQEEI